MWECLTVMWGQEMDVVELDGKPGWVAKAGETDPVANWLEGNVLGSIEDSGWHWEKVPGIEPVADKKRVVRAYADSRLFVSDLVMHSRVMQRMAGGNQRNKIMAAQCLSSSCVNSGEAVRWVPKHGNRRLSDAKLVQLLRMRFGVPRVFPIDKWQCDCKPRNKGNGAVDREFARVMECHAGEVMHGVQLGDEPFHALCCRWRQGTLIHRHDAIAKALMGALRRISGVRVTGAEPNAQDPKRPNARADIRVTVDGTTMLLDVGVVCPATSNYVGNKHTATVPGAAAAAGEEVKRKRHEGTRTKVHPFIVETGGRLGEEARQFVDGLGGRSEGDKIARARLFREVGQTLVHEQLYMMTNLVAQLAERRERWPRELWAQGPVPPRPEDVGYAAAGRAAEEAAEKEAEECAAAAAALLAAQGGAGGAGAGSGGGKGGAGGFHGRRYHPDSQPPPFPKGKDPMHYQGRRCLHVHGGCWIWKESTGREDSRVGKGRKMYLWEGEEGEDDEEEEEEEDEDDENRVVEGSGVLGGGQEKTKDDNSKADEQDDGENQNDENKKAGQGTAVIHEGSGN
jgi:hypothetical protein